MSVIRTGSRVIPGRVQFTFDGRVYVAQPGDSVASALLANGVRLHGRSVKYRRPRGLLTLGPEEPNALLSVGVAPDVIPNVPAPVLAVREGLAARSQNRWPTLRWDLSALLQAGGGFFGAGFYYKTFIWPSWRTYERMIRNLAGLGEAPGESSLPPASVEHLSCDVLVGGGGPAGIAAALAAARAGASVVLCEREPVLGGELEFESGVVEGLPAAQWLRDAADSLASHGVRVLTETTVIGGSDGLLIAHAEPGGVAGHNRVYRIRPRQFVIAMGAIERTIAFVDNDRPGVMLVGAAERLLSRYGVRAAARPILFGNHDRLYAAAQRFLAAGVAVRAIVDTRPASATPGSAAVRAELATVGVECLNGYAVLSARGSVGVRAAEVAPLDDLKSARRLDCDGILVSGGWSPAVHAGLHEGGVRRFDGDSAAYVAGDQPDWRTTAGAAAGSLELDVALATGHAAGVRAAHGAGRTADTGRAPAGRGDAAPALVPFWRSPASLAGEKRQFVDLQNDVTVADLRLALAEGFVDVEHVKRYTTLGIGTDQGRLGGVLGAAILAELRGVQQPDVGVTRTRPPYHPFTIASAIGHRVGQHYRPTRRTPLHAWHAGNGGVPEDAGYWIRIRYYRANGSDPTAAGIAEARRVREHGGVFDGSTLGKIEIAGRDAAAFLDRMYLTKASTIRVGRSKYMVNLREDGMVLDDGIVLRLAEDRFVATTSSGHADHMLSHFEHYRDTEWSGRAVAVTGITEAWAVIVVAGPASRDAVRAVLGGEWSESLSRLGHMDFAEGLWRGAELRVLRASFSGELAFELHCRPAIAAPLWESLVDAGLSPYGLEALDILRLEKGYLVSSELTGDVTPQDLGMSGMLKLGNSCIGRELLDRPAFQDPLRPRLVGLRAADGKSAIAGGAQITTRVAPAQPVGYVSSSAFSPALNEWIALAFVSRAIAEGEEVLARDPLRTGDTRVVVTSIVHFDPGSERIKS